MNEKQTGSGSADCLSLDKRLRRYRGNGNAGGKSKETGGTLMNTLEAAMIVIGLLALRFAIPLALAYGVCCGMNRLAADWDEPAPSTAP
jgi:hypothetical protein